MSPALRLHRDAPPAGVDPGRDWLDAFGAAMPERERGGAVDELASHLRERAADLGREGAASSLAWEIALNELGDPLELARQYARAANRTRRRTRMHAALIAASGLTLLAAAALRREGSVPVAGGAPAAPAVAGWSPADPADPDDPIARVRLTVPRDITWERLEREIAVAAGVSVQIRYFWLGALPGGGISPGTNLGHDLHDSSLASLLRLVNEELNLGPDDGVACRVEDGSLVISTLAHFDSLDTTLVAYELAPLVDDAERRLGGARADVEAQVVEAATGLITELVSPNLWTANGGDRASIRRFGTKVFVSAPRRLLPRIEWVLGELSRDIELGARTAADGSTIQVRADAGKIVLVRPDGTEVRCDQLSLDLRGRGVLDAVGVVDRSPPVLASIPLIQSYFKRQHQPLRDFMLNPPSSPEPPAEPAPVPAPPQ